MADTGAPWNIPFVEPTDLVRDYPAADEAQALAVAAGLTAAGNAGIGSNVVQSVLTTSITTSASSPVDVSELDTSITLSSSDSKVLVILSIVVEGDAEQTACQILRGSTQFSDVFVTHPGSGVDGRTVGTWVFLDSPDATSVSYSVRFRRRTSGSSTLFAYDGNTAGTTFTVIEVEG